MENLEKYTPTELLKMINDIKLRHNKLREEAIEISFEFDKLEQSINLKLDEINLLEKNYIDIIEVMNNKNAI